jgi:hypothetical protein
MNFALLIVGQARYFDKGYESIKKNIIDVYNPDIFIHTWKYENNIAHAAPWNNLGDIVITDKHIYNYINLYKPCYFEIEKSLNSDLLPIEKTYTRTSHPNTRYNFYSYLYSLNKCYQLSKKTGKTYDYYIIVRSDVLIRYFPKINDIRPNYFILWNRFHMKKEEALDTMICFVPFSYINDYANFYLRLDEYYNKGYLFNYEQLMYAHFFENNFLKNTIMLDNNKFSWGYFRNNNIEYIHYQ